MNMNSNTKKNGLTKRIIGFLAVLSIITSMAMPVSVHAKSTGLLAFLTSFTVPAEAADETVFPESEDRTPVKSIIAVVTAYTSRPEETDSTPCITANGHDLCRQYDEGGFGNTVAANGIPFGTHVKFPELFGDKVFIVRDRMNARYGYGRVDVWMPELAEAKKFGVKRVTMEIF